MKKILIILLFPLVTKAQLGVPPGVIFNNPPFTPASIPNLKFWVKADQITGLSDGDPVSTWTDQSAIGNNVTASSTARPTYKTNILNSLPVVRFDGTDDVMNKASFSGIDGVSGMTIFIVVKQASLDVSKTYLSKWDYATQGTFAWQTFFGGPGEFTCFVADAVNDPGNNQANSTTAMLTTNFFLIEMVYDGSLTNANRVKYYVNTSLVTPSISGTIPTSLVTSTADFRVGSFGGLGRYYNGDFGEILVYSSALSAPNRASVETYLNAKWAIY